MFSPLRKALQVENVQTLRLAKRSGILLNDFHLANCTHIFGFIFQVLIFLFLDYAGQFLPCAFYKLINPVSVDYTTCYYISQVFIRILAFLQQRIVQRQIKDLCESVKGVHAMHGLLVVTRAFELIANCELKFHLVRVFQNEACSTCDSHQIVLLFTVKIPLRHFNKHFLENLCSLLSFLGLDFHIFIYYTLNSLSQLLLII